MKWLILILLIAIATIQPNDKSMHHKVTACVTAHQADYTIIPSPSGNNTRHRQTRGHNICASCTSKCQMEISRVCVFLMLSKTLCIWHKLCTDCADCWLTSFLFWLGENVCSPLGELWSIPPPPAASYPELHFSALCLQCQPPLACHIYIYTRKVASKLAKRPPDEQPAFSARAEYGPELPKIKPNVKFT